MPFVEPEAYYKDVPTKREQIFRHIQLAHLGAEGQIKESVIVRANDRQVSFWNEGHFIIVAYKRKKWNTNFLNRLRNKKKCKVFCALSQIFTHTLNKARIFYFTLR